jgi:general secretion pathway protein D
MKPTRLFTIAIIFSAALFAFAEIDPNLAAAESTQTTSIQATAAPAPFVPLDESGGIVFDFQDAPLTDVLNYLSEKAGFVIVSDAVLSTRITIKSKQPVGEADIVTVLNTVLIDNGYTAIKVGRALKIVDISSARHDNVPVSSGSDPDVLPDTDEVITHIIPIRFAEATSLREDIQSLVSDTADLTSNEASNSLIITDTALNIKRIMKVVKAVDTQMASIASVRVFHLVYAEADNTANIINEVFEQASSNSSRNDNNPFSRFMRGGGPFGGDRGGNNNESSSAGISQNVKVVASADDMTNTVVVSGPSDTLEVVAQVVKELDTNPDEDRTLFVYKLENADSENIKVVLNDLFDAAESQDSNNNQDRRFGNAGNNNNNSSSTEVSDQVFIEADSDTNSLIIMTSEKNYMKIKPIIEELDQPVPQVLIKVLVAEVTVNNSFNLGTEFSLANVDSDGDNRNYSTELLSNGTDAIPLTLDGANFRILQSDLDFTLNALSTSGKVNVLSRPYVLTSNNQLATINVGKEVPYITDSNVSEGVITNSIEYQNIGISLEVTPKINSKGFVTMDIAPEVSTISEDETVSISENFNATVFTTRSCSGRVAVKDGQTIVVGGLMEDDDSEIVKKVPLLGDLPLLGVLFRSTEKSNEKKELLIFLTPIVAQRESELASITEHESAMSESMQGMNDNPALRSQMENMKSVPQK